MPCGVRSVSLASHTTPCIPTDAHTQVLKPMNEPILPENDPDLILARKLGTRLEKRSAPLTANERPVADQLRKLKQASRVLQGKYYPDQSTSIAMWHAIEAATKPTIDKEQPPAKIFQMRPLVYRMAVAASLLVAIVLGWYLTRTLPEPVLLASAAQTIVTHTLTDGTDINLRPHSNLYRISENDQQVVYRLEGEAFFDVTSNPDRTFSVEAGDALISVLGTEFNVNTWGDQVNVFLQEGRVELIDLTSGEAVILQPGQAGTVHNANRTVELREGIANEHLDWLENKISFTQVPLSTIVQELEFHFAINIDVPAKRASETFTGPILLGDVSIVLDQLSFVMGGGRFVPTDETSYRFESN